MMSFVNDKDKQLKENIITGLLSILKTGDSISYEKL